MAEENSKGHSNKIKKAAVAEEEGSEEEEEEEEEEEGEGDLSSDKALQQCDLNQDMIDISISSLEGLRTKCSASNDLTQQEIRMLEVKLVKYISKQLQCKHKVPPSERTSELERYPRLSDWFRTINLRKEIIQEVPGDLTLDILLNMSDTKVCEVMKRYGANPEECCRLNAALSCLRSINDSGGELQDDTVLWTSSETRRESSTASPSELFCPVGSRQPHSPSPVPRLIPSPPRSISVSVIPTSESICLPNRSDNLVDPFSPSPRPGRRTSGPQTITITPPATPPSKKKHRFKPPRTPPPPSRKLIQLFPGFSGLTRSKSHESQLGNRIDEVPTIKFGKKNKFFLNLNINGSGSSCDDIATRSPLMPCRPFFPQSIGSSHCVPTTPCPSDDHSSPKNTLHVPRGSPQMVQRDFGLSITHRFSTKSWLSQTCQVCQKNMMFGVKCKHCRLKCHNKCTKEAPPCRISFPQISSKIRRTESVPSDINNSVDRSAEPQFGTLPKALKKDHAPVPLDSSSNPSSTTSSTPSSPAPFQSSNPPSATPPPNPSPKGPRDRFKFPAAYYFHHRQQFIFPDVPSPSLPVTLQPDNSEDTNTVEETEPEVAEDLDAENEDHGLDDEEVNKSESECETDEVDDLPNTRSYYRGLMARKPSQTSVFLQEWDIPFHELEVGELIGKGRWGKVHKGRWHGEVAIRLLEIDGNNQDHLKLFKKEVMTYRQTRHENVVLFMGACMHPPHLAIITSFCKGRTLFSFVRDSKITLDINKIRQIAQEIIKGMGYLHARGIVHKDLKSKNIFYDNGKVVITDFGLFGISGVVQEDRRENELKLPNGWLCYVAPEIVQEMYSGKDEDKLPFSKAGDVYAFGTIWYELQAREWPFKNQPVEAIIWQVGSGEGVQNLLAQISLGKEVTEILSACWSYDQNERPTFTQLMDMLEKLPKLNRRLSHPGHFWKSAELSF
ncbi:kinase suppressor of Ras 1-like isoform X3 [Hemiscyllium ocellatum]|uniref:kinase suppressor of Ras 1-like isoform X3 n=2 Tax=Hemiscyllium ocellatum TaxID=170820 RepID=UPI0029675DD7|nr:kinase suppressor of Ras 1-like isoform X3 [Hemiscyllium ocellatum]XP_060703838.1 kinase suppressor of Ras 1-like isoform X3 [Hemiscyllium ocellatum]XP_060703839.1 kinase suppressor of Ras 1-like isoform X3 [Hemiscyllium ocellatum]XP_060703840.1 kinase suppressor of Ras 1-like isoform X3 [Hemiscyllium ocellatum]